MRYLLLFASVLAFSSLFTACNKNDFEDAKLAEHDAEFAFPLFNTNITLKDLMFNVLNDTLSGDTLFVNRAPQVFVYGEVQRAGAYRIERQMTVLQALAMGGGLSQRGTERGVRIHRRSEDGAVRVLTPQLNDLVQADDVIVVREALF